MSCLAESCHTVLALVGSGVIGLAVGDVEGLDVVMTGTGRSYTTFPTLYIESRKRYEISSFSPKNLSKTTTSSNSP
jgi:hypothetical protein